MFMVYVALCGFPPLISEAFAGSIFDKFYQSDYKLKFEHADLVSYDKNIFKRFEILSFKYNRTCAAVNGTYELKVDLNYDLEVVVQAYKFASNEYRHFPIRFQANACHALSKNIAGAANFFKCGNYTGCPLKKGKLERGCNWTIDEARLPPMVPSGRYMVNMQLLYHDKEIGVANSYCEVYRPIPIPT